MLFCKVVTIADDERGLLFRNRKLEAVLKPGKHRFFNPWNRYSVETVSMLNPVLAPARLPVLIASGLLAKETELVELADHQRGLLWVNGSLYTVLGPGHHLVWQTLRKTRVEVVDIRPGVVELENLPVLVRHSVLMQHVDLFTIEQHEAGLLFRDGKLKETLAPGLYAYWKGGARFVVRKADQRETPIEVAGQDILTSDNVTIRVTAVVVAQVVDPVAALQKAPEWVAAIYRETQLILRKLVGTRTLEELLADKDATGTELLAGLQERGRELGLQVLRAGIRDLILPGEMRTLLNKVTEARKAAEASVITRREETASMRHQANTAKILENNPALLRLKELETLEKVASHGKLFVTAGDGKKLGDLLSNLI